MRKVMRSERYFFAAFLLGAFFALPVFGQTSATSVAFPAADSRGGALAGTIQLSSGAIDENTAVYLEGVTGNYPVPQQAAAMDQKDGVFVPHLLPVQKGQTVRFKNSDSFTHNVHLFWRRRSVMNVSQSIGRVHEWIPPRLGEYAVRCNIHREMSAFVLVLEHPFFAAVGHQGSSPSQFKIEGIPEGAYTLVAAREIDGDVERQEQEVTIEANQTTTVRLTIPERQ